MKKNVIKNHVKSLKIIKTLTSAGIAHTLELTTNTTIVSTTLPNGKVHKYIVSDSEISHQALGFIGKVKRDVNRRATEKKTYRPPSYFQFLTKRQGIFTDVVEVDVNSAYWKIAYLKGYISPEIYQEGLTVDKMTRLVALGSIATVKSKYYFDGTSGDYQHTGDIVNEITRSYFFDVAHELGFLMGKCLQEIGKEHCFFYWVDAFFVTTQAAEQIKAFFLKNDLEVKTKEVVKMGVKRTGEGWQVMVREKKEDGKTKDKPFFFPFGDGRKALIARTRRDIKKGNTRTD